MSKSLANSEIDKLGYFYELSKSGKRRGLSSSKSLAEEYMRNNSKHGAAKKFIANQKKQCQSATQYNYSNRYSESMAPFMENLLRIELQAVVTIACIGGYDLESDCVKTLVYSCISGFNIESFFNDKGIKISEQLTLKAIEKFPDDILNDVNRYCGISVVSKYENENAIFKIIDFVPILRGIIASQFFSYQFEKTCQKAWDTFIKSSIDSADFRKKPRDDGLIELNLKKIHNEDESNRVYWKCEESNWEAYGKSVVFSPTHSGEHIIIVSTGYPDEESARILVTT